jgi:hypothetical protein
VDQASGDAQLFDALRAVDEMVFERFSLVCGKFPQNVLIDHIRLSYVLVVHFGETASYLYSGDRE